MLQAKPGNYFLEKPSQCSLLVHRASLKKRGHKNLWYTPIFVCLAVLVRLYEDAYCPTWVPKCRHIKEFHNSLEWSITSVYLFGGILTVKVAIWSSLYALKNRNWLQQKRGSCMSSSALTVPETIPKVGRYLKGYFLKQFLQYSFISWLCHGVSWQQ